MAWLAMLALTWLMAIAIVIPGMLFAVIAGRSWRAALAMGPALTCAISAVIGQLLAALRLPWQISTLFAGWVIVWAATLLIRAGIERKFPDFRDIFSGLRKLISRGSPWITLIFLGLAFAIQAFTVWPIMATPGALLQNHDALFHYNGAEVIATTRSAPLVGALNDLYSNGANNYYPAVWHELVALFAPYISIAVATNALASAFTMLIWPLGVMLWARVEGINKYGAWMAGILAAASVTYPVYNGYLFGLFPMVAMVAVLPGAFAGVASLPSEITQQKARADYRQRDALAPAIASVLTLLAPLVIHPAAIGFVLLWLVVYAPTYAGRFRIAGLAVTLLTVALIVFLAFQPAIANMANSMKRVDKLSWVWRVMGAGGPPYEAAWTDALPLFILACIGAILLLRKSPRIVALWVILGLVGLGANYRWPIFSGFSGIWYGSYERLGTLSVAVVAILGGAAVGKFAEITVTGWRKVASGKQPGLAIGILVTLVCSAAMAGLTQGYFYQLKQDWTARGYDPNRLMHHPWVSEAEKLAMTNLKLEPNAKVIGDPSSGAGLLPIYTDIEVVFPRNGRSGWSKDDNYLADNFYRIHDDPRICKLLRDEGIKYYYDDAAGNDPVDASFKGLHGVDTSRGFRKIAQLDQAKIYLITACGADLDTLGPSQQRLPQEACAPAVTLDPPPNPEFWDSPEQAAPKAVVNREIRGKDVIPGKNQFYFWGDAIADNFSQALGKDVQDSAGMTEWIQYFRSVQAQLKREGRDLLVIVGPAKWSVYSQNLPDWARQARGETNLDILRKSAPDLPLIDLRQELRAYAASPEGASTPIYSGNNSHWSPYGAYRAWGQVTRCLQAWKPDTYAQLRQPEVSSIDIFEIDNEYAQGGAQERKLRDWSIPQYASPPPEIQLENSAGKKTSKRADKRVGLEELPQTMRNPQAPIKERVLLLRDSMADALSGPVNMTFQEVKHVGHNYDLYRSPQPANPVTEARKADAKLVIIEVAERYLGLTPPAIPATAGAR